MRRVRLRIQPLLDEFGEIEFEHPIYQAVLVGVTDEKPDGFLQEIENSDGFFQVLAGCAFHESDDVMTSALFEVLRRATDLCPFADNDRAIVKQTFERVKSRVVE